MPCPSPEMLARCAQGVASPGEVAWVTDHAAGCTLCGPIVRATGQSPAAAATATASLWPSGGDDVAAATHSDVAQSGVSAAGSIQGEAVARVPSHVGPYSVEGVLGHGGMGVVYRARDPRTQRVVAVKTVGAQRRALLAGLRDEIRFLSEVRHPGVVEIFDFDAGCEIPWYAMELLEGATLATRNRALWGALGDRPARAVGAGAADGGAATVLRSPMHSVRRPPAAGGRLADVLTTYSDVCEPLAFVHRAGIVHCDLKPANVFLRPDGRPVLADFGLLSNARGAIGRETLTTALRVRGTLPYVSPEIVEERIPDARADLYALGCMLYESVTGAPPFWSPAKSQLLRMHVEAQPEPPSARVDGVDPALDRLILGLLAKRPRDRVNDADEVAEVLRALVGKRPSQPPSGSRPRKSTVLFRPHVAGRDDAIAFAVDRCNAAWQGHGSVLMTEGESGIGKTFFANEVAQRAARNGLQVVAGEAISVRAGDGPAAPAAPLQLFQAFLVNVADRCREHGTAETARLLGPNTKLLAEIESSLAQLPGAETWPTPSPLPPAAARDRHIRAVLDVIARLAETQPLLLTLDDVQWADDLSMAVLESLSEEFLSSCPVVVLAAYRSEEAPAAIRQIASRPWVQRIELRRLSPTEVGSIMSDMLASSQIVPRVVEYVHAQTEGVPFFVAEYLRAMTEEGLLERTAGEWRITGGADDIATALDALPLPGVLADVVRRRLSVLPPDCRAALEAGAVLGRRFRLAELSPTTGQAAGALSAVLARALEHRLLEREADSAYRFPHDKIREALYADVTPRRRRELHAAAGSALCELFAAGEGLEERYGIIAHHFQKADLPARAVPFLARAGERALQLSATADAVTYLREALALEATLDERPSPLERATWSRMLGQALQGLGLVQESIEPLGVALELLGDRVRVGGAAFVPALLGELGAQVARRIAPGNEEGAPTAASQRLERGRTLDALTQAYFYTGQNGAFVLSAVKTLNVLEGMPPSAELALAYARVAATAAFLMPSLAPRYFEMAHATLGQVENPSTASQVEMLHGLTSAIAGRRVDADRRLLRALAFAERASHYRQWDECASIRGSQLLICGLLVEAATQLEGLEASARRRGDEQMIAWALLIRGQWAIRTGRYELAADLHASAASARERLALPERIWVEAQGAYVAHLCGDPRLARERCERAATLIANTPPPQPHLADAVAMLTEVRLALAAGTRGGPDGAPDLREAKSACAILARTARMHALCVPAACLLRGVLLHFTGRTRAAREVWARGLRAARAREFPYEEARIEDALAAAAASPADATAHHERVDELTRRLGVPRSAVSRPWSTGRT